jgi:hypothetical protein
MKVLTDSRIAGDLGDKRVVDLSRIERAQSHAAQTGDLLDPPEEAG